ncbi:MAG TPA: 7TM diverse intracellular signaling domain-containing protein [Myxococcaceae bacterium]|jgi:hypothetical protein
MAPGWVVWVGLVLAAGAWAAPVPAPPEGGRLELAPFIEVVEDRSGTLTVEQVATGPLPRWRPASAGELNVGFSPSAYWVHFTLASGARWPEGWLLELGRTIDSVELYAELPSGGFARQHTGRMLPVRARAVPDTRLLLELPVPPASTGRYWLRLSGENTLVLGPVLWERSAHFGSSTEESLLLGASYGLLLGLLIYNLFLFLSTRDSAYGAYVLFQLGLVLMHAGGDQLTLRYLWPDAPEWAARGELMFIGTVLFAAPGFARRFLGLSTSVPAMDRVLRVLMGLALVFIALAALGASSSVMRFGAVLALACAGALVGSGVLAWRAGNPNASVFLVAWVLLLAGALVSTLMLLGQLPMTPWTANGTRLGSAAEALLLSLGLARRIKLLRQESARARAELLESRLEYARTLEARVEERTRELSATLEELRATQARLVQQARLASLGHLVAGVAHEVGNPLNFTSGGASDLARRLRALQTELEAQPLPAEASERVGRMLQGAGRALKLVLDGNARIRTIVENLRGYVRSRDASLEEVDLVAELETTLGLLQPQLEAAGIRVERRLEPLPRVACRPGELGQVFMNLLLNSAQAMPGGGDIVLASRCVEGRLELSFQDSGPGIAPEHREAIFDPFFTTRPPNEGTGLGLSISHEIAVRHGGELRLVESERGARFVLTLPLPAGRSSVQAG